LIHFYKRIDRMSRLAVLVCMALAVQGAPSADTSANEMISIIIGGFGGGVNTEVITPTGICRGTDSSPGIPLAEFSSNFGWSAAVFSKGLTNGEILLCGGKTQTETEKCHTLPLGEGNWKSDSCSLDKQRVNADMFTTNDGRVVVSGGYSERIGWLSDIQIMDTFDPDCTVNCCSWTNVGTIDGKGVYSHCSLQYDDDHFVFMGGNTWDVNGQYDIADVQIFNFRTGEWKRGQDMPIPRQGHGCIKTTHNGKEGIMVAGGFCNGNPAHESCYQLRINQTAFYDFGSDSWEMLGDLNYARDGMILQDIGGDIYTIGGENTGQPVTHIEKFVNGAWEMANMDLLDKVSSFAHVQVPSTAYRCP